MTTKSAELSSASRGTPPTIRRRLPIGADVQPGGTVHFRLWAPRRHRVELVLEGARRAPGSPESISLTASVGGYFEGLVSAPIGIRYRYRLDDEAQLYPDPASRYQPEGPHGPSEVIDPSLFSWTDDTWRGVPLEGQVFYEMHVGTFTPEGTWDAAAARLPELAELGITVIEMMPVADFAGLFGWGYDGVDLFAPTRLYGRPDDLRRFVDRAHAQGLAVILDVVYNHFGPDGCYLRAFSDDYFTALKNEWGDGISFDGPNSQAVREFFIANAGYWIDEFHMDGLRLDATQSIQDTSSEHVLMAIGRRVRDAAPSRSTIVVAENEPQLTQLVRAPESGGYGLDALWNDDFHHAATVARTGRREAFYTDYHGHPQEFISAIRWGFLYQGQRYSWQRQRRGTDGFDLPPWRFVIFLQNHDQVANSAKGLRRHFVSNPGRYRALTTLMLLGPATPLLFQGQEFWASTPFLFFADHQPELAALVRQGRGEFLSQFPSLAQDDVQRALADPSAPETFERCKLDHREREQHADAYALHRDLLQMRREEPAFRAQGAHGIDGAVLSPSAFVIRFFGGPQGDQATRVRAGMWQPRDETADRLLLVNLGAELYLGEAPEPLLAPPHGHAWTVQWSSEHPRYGGSGTAAVETAEGWYGPAEAAVVLKPAPVTAGGFSGTPLARRGGGARKE